KCQSGSDRLACIWKCNHRSARRCSYRRRWRVFDSAAINAAQDFELPIRRELSRARVQGIDDSARSERFMANGKKRPPYLAAEEFHDDRAAQSGRFVHVHALLGI